MCHKEWLKKNCEVTVVIQYRLWDCFHPKSDAYLNILQITIDAQLQQPWNELTNHIEKIWYFFSFM